jgi:hypothetical protein
VDLIIDPTCFLESLLNWTILMKDESFSCWVSPENRKIGHCRCGFSHPDSPKVSQTVFQSKTIIAGIDERTRTMSQLPWFSVADEALNRQDIVCWYGFNSSKASNRKTAPRTMVAADVSLTHLNTFLSVHHRMERPYRCHSTFWPECDHFAVRSTDGNTLIECLHSSWPFRFLWK